MLLAQDTLVLLKIQAVASVHLLGLDEFGWAKAEWALTYAELGLSLGISASQAHNATKRLIDSGLVDDELRVRKKAASEWLIHGVKYFLPPKLGGLTRGMPTSYAALPLNSVINNAEASGEPPPVWSSVEGIRGISFEPIYKTAPLAASKDAVLYEYLALLDAIRSGRTRES